MFNYTDTIISQYANSPTLTRLIEDFNAYIDPLADLDAFYSLIWNVATAQGEGLNIWGRIVGVNRVVYIPAGTKYLGFDEATTVSADPFNQSPYYSGQPLTSNYPVSDTGFRTMIYAKALSNICDGSIPAINQVLLLLFPGRGNCYVVDNLDMTMIYHFSFVLTALEQAIVTQSGVLPKPAGVSATVVSM